MQARILPQLVELAAKPDLPTVATGDVHYLRDTDARAHEALLCIQSGDSLKNPNHWKFETDHFYFKSPEEMALDFPGHDGRDAAHARGRRALQRRDRARPDPAAAASTCRRAATRSTTSSSSARRASQSRYDKVTAELQERLKYELKTIKEMGFTDYFLIVWDFIHFAKTNGVSRRPGPRLVRRLARRLLRSRSPTSTRSATT